MFVTVLVRRLKPGKTYDDFLRAWYPDKGFGFPGQGPFLARNVNDPAEILAYGLVYLPERSSMPLARPSDPGAAGPFGSSPHLGPVAEFGLFFKREPGSAVRCSLIF